MCVCVCVCVCVSLSLSQEEEFIDKTEIKKVRRVRNAPARVRNLQFFCVSLFLFVSVPPSLPSLPPSLPPLPLLSLSLTLSHTHTNSLPPPPPFPPRPCCWQTLSPSSSLLSKVDLISSCEYRQEIPPPPIAVENDHSSLLFSYHMCSPVGTKGGAARRRSAVAESRE